jgi:polar amino acid transport system substrate-binding protein
MKKLLLLITIVLAVVSVQAQTLKVVTENYPPYNYTENGKVVGFSTEVVQEVLDRADLDYEINAYPWARTYSLAQSQPNTLIYSIGRNEKREKLFKWVDVIAPYNVYLYKMKGNDNVKVSNLNEAKNYKIGCVRKDVRTDYLEGHGFNNLDQTNSDVINLKKIFNGRIDLYPTDEIGGAYLAKQEGFDASKLEKVFFIEDLSSGLYMAFSLKTDDAIVNKCKKALAEIKDDGTFEKIKAKYLK